MAVSGVSSYALKRAEKELAQSKVVIRHLPPDMTEEQLSDLLSPIIQSYTSFVYVSGQSNDPYSFSRAYLNVASLEDIKKLRDSLDGHQLESPTSRSKYRIIVEYAPYQCNGVPRAKPDARCGTIENDPDYITFLENYEKEVVYLPSIDLSYFDHIEVIPDVQSTPLVEYITDKKHSRRSSSRHRITHTIVSSSSSKKKRGAEKIKVYEVKDRASRNAMSSSKEKKEKNKKSNDINSSASSVVTNGDGSESTTSQGKGEGKREEERGGSQKVSRSKDRPDQAFYSPRTKDKVDRGSSAIKSDGSRSSDSRGSDRSGGKESKGGRDGKGGSGTIRSDRGGSEKNGSERYESDRRNGDGRGRSGQRKNWHKEDYGGPSSRSYGNRKQPADKNEHYYQFEDDDDQQQQQPRSTSDRRDEPYHSTRRNDQYGRRDDQYGKRDDQYGRRDDQYGRRDDQYGRRDDQYGRRDDQYGRRDDRRDDRRDGGWRGGRGGRGRGDYHHKRSSSYK